MCCISQDVVLRYIDFGGVGQPTSFESKFLAGRTYRLIMDDHIYLEKGVQWLDKPLGGFDLLGGIYVGVDTKFVLQFY